MQRHSKWLVTALVLPIALSACSRESAFDRAATVDVCGMVDQTAVERIVGPLSRPPQTVPLDYGRGFAGACSWSFKSAVAPSENSLRATLSTPGSRITGEGFDPWSETNLKEVEANLGPRMEVKGLGDKALLFGSGNTQDSEIWMQQGKSYAVIRMTGARSSQLVAFARILAGDIVARQASSTASDAVTGSNAPASAVAAAQAQGRTPDAREVAQDAQATATEAEARAREAQITANAAQADSEKEATVALYTMGYVEECIRTDDLVRNICSRMGKVMPDEDKVYCDLPAQTFQQRTSAAYEAFKQKYAAQIAAHAPDDASTLEGARQSFETQYGHMRADPVSMLEFQSVARDLPNHCATVEKEWLPKVSGEHQGP